MKLLNRIWLATFGVFFTLLFVHSTVAYAQVLNSSPDGQIPLIESTQTGVPEKSVVEKLSSYQANERIIVEMDRRYIEILEKTNEQLGLWTNPYGVAIGVLAAFFTLLTIIVAWALYRQSQDYKNNLERDRKDNQKKFDDFIEAHQNKLQELWTAQQKFFDQKKEQVQAAEGKLNGMIENYEKKLSESSKETKKQKTKIQDIIDKLNEEKAALISRSSFSQPIVASSFDDSAVTWTSVGGGKVLHKCKHCGFGFYVDRWSDGLAVTTTADGGRTAKCPKCGSMEEINYLGYLGGGQF